ncbi:hypothetical protein F0U60_42075 [Archangium minus]|uniref:Uncharacterized protein n=1 Tax=Archangium minus TaxID=83450 RepID=A0ABY9X3M8_9BACT|nr:hypothetical protein F0U60_42075 [Archangium minus]
MNALVGCARRVAEAVSFPEVSDAELYRRLHDILYGEKDAWEIAVAGVITRTEAAYLVLANLQSWLISRSIRDDAQDWPNVDHLVRDVEDALFGARERQ